MSDHGSQPGRRPRSAVWGAVVGALVGLGVGSAAYGLVNPLLEGSNSWIEEFQGFLWNLVPLLTLGGAVLGWWVMRSRRHG